MRTEDLHGLTLQEAYKVVTAIIDECHQDSTKKVRMITGKGLISQEFEGWMDTHPRVRKVEPSKDRGSYTLWIAIRGR